MKKTYMNDQERENWVLNDEGLYTYWKQSRLSMRNFIRTNRELIDRVIKTACGN